MPWALARERLGAELIGAREQIADRWRAALRDAGVMAHALSPVAPELVLQAGASLADGASPESPWCRSSGLLRIDGTDGGTALQTELTLLWRSMGHALSRVACTAEEEQAARAALGHQLDAALRGATAAVRAALLDDEVDEPLRWGGVVVVTYGSNTFDADDEHRAA